MVLFTLGQTNNKHQPKSYGLRPVEELTCDSIHLLVQSFKENWFHLLQWKNNFAPTKPRVKKCTLEKGSII